MLFECARFAGTGQTWWVHAKVISPSIHLCQGISLGNSPKCGNSLGTDWCRRVKKAESECMCVPKWVCVCVCDPRANSKANKRKLALSYSALVCSCATSPLGSAIASSVRWKFGHQIPSKTDSRCIVRNVNMIIFTFILIHLTLDDLCPPQRGLQVRNTFEGDLWCLFSWAIPQLLLFCCCCVFDLYAFTALNMKAINMSLLIRSTQPSLMHMAAGWPSKATQCDQLRYFLIYIISCYLQSTYIIPALALLDRAESEKAQSGCAGMLQVVFGCIPSRLIPLLFPGWHFSLWQGAEGWGLVSLSTIPHRSVLRSNSGAAQYTQYSPWRPRWPSFISDHLHV